MSLQGDIAEEKTPWVRKQLEAIDAAGTTTAADIQGMSVVVFTVRGAKSGKLRRVPLMRVEHDGSYAAIASKGGAPANPQWYHNILANPDVEVQDGSTTVPGVARVAAGAEREQWWERAVAAYPPYADYQKKTDRQIPVVIVETRA